MENTTHALIHTNGLFEAGASSTQLTLKWMTCAQTGIKKRHIFLNEGLGNDADSLSAVADSTISLISVSIFC